MSKVSMSPIVAVILVLAAIASSGPASAQVQVPEGPMPGMGIGGPMPGVSTGRPDMADESARHYRERARYPQDSYPLQAIPLQAIPPDQAGQPDPIQADRTPWPSRLPSLDPSAPVITTWQAQVSFEYPAPVDLFLSLTPGEGAPPGSVVAPALSVRGEIVNQAGEVIGTIDYRDDGATPDERAGDGIYAARFIMPKAQVPDLVGAFNVRIEMVMADGTVERFRNSFDYANPHAHLTGRYRDAVRRGSLVISAEIKVRKRGRFHLAGTIASQQGEPIGYAQTAAKLEPGRHWLHLQFYGLMFHDRNIAGPYKLASLVLRTTTRMPGTIGAPVLNAHVTRAYRLDQMTTKSFDEPNLLDAARRIEGDAGAGMQPKP